MDSNTLFVDSANNRVGIGTASPAYRLDVNGASRLGSNFIVDSNGDAYQPITGGVALWVATGNATYPSYGFYGDTGIGMYRAAADTLAFSTSDTERLRITSAGNVGIGTTGPAAKLTVVGATTVIGQTNVVARFSDDFNSTLLISHPASTSATATITGNEQLAFATGAVGNIAERLRITSGGNVGIGTTSPDTKLQVIGNIGVGAGTYNGGIYANSSSSGIDSNWGFDIARTDGVADYSTRLKYYPNTGESRKGGIYNSLSNTWVLYGDSNNTPNVIIPSGNVGIGTTAPYSKLQVNGNITANYTDAIYLDYDLAPDLYAKGFSGRNQSTTVARGLHIFAYDNDSAQGINFWTGTKASPLHTAVITNAGNVGIGTTSPTVTLEVSGRGLITSSGSSDTFAVTHSSGSGIGVNITKGGNGEGLYVNKTSGSGNAVTIVGTLNATTLVKSGGTSSQYLMADGSVSTLTNPVTGTGTTNYVPKWTSGSAIGNSQIFDNGTNVGIGTASPLSKLSVSPSNNDGVGLYDSSNNLRGLLFINNTGGVFSTGIRTGNYWLDLDASGTSQNAIRMFTGTGGIGTGTERMRIDASGNVGIGTTSPAGTLDIGKNNATPSLVIGNSAYGANFNSVWGLQSGAQSIMIFGNNGQNEIRAGNTGVGGYLDFYTNNTASFTTASNGNFVMRLSSGGNVGIGTTSPSFKLDVAGADSDWATRFYSNAGASAYFAHGGGYGGYINAGSNASSSTYLLELISNGSTRVYVRGDGNVGIGTTSPVTKLDVNGSINIANGNNLTWGGAYGAGIPTIASAINAGIYFYPAGSTSGATMLINSSGNVGIGTTAPSFPLSVQGIAQARGGVYVTQASPINTLILNADDTALHKIYTNSSVDLSLGTNSSTSQLYLKNGGNVGIGTTSPNYKLQVAGNVSILNGASDSLLGGSALYLEGGSGSNYTILQQGIGRFTIWGYNGSSWGEKFTINNTSGNVGIGTTAPVSKLDVFGEGRFNVSAAANTTATALTLVNTTDAENNGVRIGWKPYNASFETAYITTIREGANAFSSLVFATSTNGWGVGGPSERMRITSAGNVGIGTASPVSISGYTSLDINNATNGGLIQLSRAGVGFGQLYNNASEVQLRSIAAVPLVFGTNSSEKMRITAAGNVGIGTTSPTNKLHVNGGSIFNQDGFLYMSNQFPIVWGAAVSIEGDNAAGTLTLKTESSHRIFINNVGNVGIGTTTPSYRLDVVGDARITSGSLGVGVAPNATDGRIDASNDIVAYQTSDQRLKENVTPIENALEKVKSLTGVEFDWIEEHKHIHGYEGHDTGIIAQQVQAVMPTAVRTNDSGYLSVRYEKLIGLLIEANKELAARVEELEKKLK